MIDLLRVLEPYWLWFLFLGIALLCTLAAWSMKDHD